MVILGLVAASSPFISTLPVDTSAGWMLLTAGFVGLAALFTTRDVLGFAWILLGALVALLAGVYLVWRPLEGLVSLTTGFSRLLCRARDRIMGTSAFLLIWSSLELASQSPGFLSSAQARLKVSAAIKRGRTQELAGS